MKTIEIAIKLDMAPYKAGEIVPVLADDAGTPIDQFWRRRLKDAAVDKCCEIVKDMPAKPAKRQKPTERVEEE